jgi:hypothetical protein
MLFRKTIVQSIVCFESPYRVDGLYGAVNPSSIEAPPIYQWEGTEPLYAPI